MTKVFVLLNHELTENQNKELLEEFEVSDIIYPSKNILDFWSNISCSKKLDIDTLKKNICSWLRQEAKENDYVIVQGEFGATFFVVDFCFQNYLIPIYSTSKRIYKEVNNNDGSISRTHVFKHECFRKYRRYL